MRHLFPLLAVLFIVGCKSKVMETPQDNIKEATGITKSSTTNVVEFITSAELKNTVSYLSSDELEGRNTGSIAIEKAAIFIEDKFKSYNVKPYFDTYRDTYTARGKNAFNVVGFIEGNDLNLKNEFIILGAHYDHIGFGKKVDNDSIANGANDNASGTSAVLAMARYFATKKNNKRSIMFVLYSGEEKGLLGSKHLAKRLKTENIDLYTMVNFEMIGVPLKDKDYVAFLTGYDLTNMASKLNDYSNSNLLGLSEVAKQYNLFRRSDNYPFYEAFNLPCQTISSCDLTNYDYYHHVDDEADQLDYDFMSSLLNKFIPAIEKMSNTLTKEIKMNE
jgi:Zn-dependent M28 family amino/carboxypeptidase